MAYNDRWHGAEIVLLPMLVAFWAWVALAWWRGRKRKR
jgi:hypothetical protein